MRRSAIQCSETSACVGLTADVGRYDIIVIIYYIKGLIINHDNNYCRPTHCGEVNCNAMFRDTLLNTMLMYA